jgi:hypothetical protein
LEINLLQQQIYYLIISPDISRIAELARIFHELLSRDREDGRATWQPSRVAAGFRGVPEWYVAGGACPEPVEGTPEDARKDGHIRGRSK